MTLRQLTANFRRLAPRYGPHYGIAAQGVPRALGLIYLLSFWSFAAQAPGLSGPAGLQPVGEWMGYLVREAPGPAPLWFPSLLWLGTGDFMLLGVCAAGMLAGLGLLWGFFPWAGAVVAWICHVSLLQVCQPWLSTPGDYLLAETGLVALFLISPKRITYPRVEEMASNLTGIVLLNALLCKVLFSSGLAQLTGGDPSWPDATAFYHFFETQSLPTIPAWYAHHLPQTLLKYAVWGLMFVEVVMPFYVVCPRVFRNLAAGGATLVALVLLLTAHYGFLPLLIMVLALSLVDDVSWRRILPAHWGPPASVRLYRPGWPGRILLMLLLPTFVIQTFRPGQWMVTLPWRGVEAVLGRVHSSNRYRLFETIPTRRLELSMQASRNGRDWIEYRMKLKPTDPAYLPPVSILHLPRLDDQLVRLAAELARDPDTPPPRWLLRLSRGVLSGNPAILRLFPVDPFPQSPPVHVRWGLYDYRFADPVRHRERGGWWMRKALGRYGPVMNRQTNPPKSSGRPPR